MSTPFAARVYRQVERVPYGRVASYGDIAALIGSPRAARGVGAALRALPEGSRVPWWRVINARGAISLGGYPGQLQAMLLRAEGIQVSGRVIRAMGSLRWRPDEEAHS